jgi:hypothetical protein
MKKIALSLVICLLGLCLLPACSGEVLDPETGSTLAAGDSGTLTSPSESDSDNGSAATTDAITLSFSDAGCAVSDTSAVTVTDSAYVIVKPGTYELSGTLKNGQVRVSVDKTEDVTLILNNLTATSLTSAPLYIESCNKINIELASGSVNTLTDARVYVYPDANTTKPNACLYSSDDMDIGGSGTLIVNGNYNNGIGCKNDLRIKDCTLNVTGVNNILKGNDSVEIENATVKLSGGEDAIKSDTTDRTDKGYILISAGSKVEINCIDDAIQATVSITVEAGCAVTGTCGGDVLNCPGTINADEGAMQISSSTQP